MTCHRTKTSHNPDHTAPEQNSFHSKLQFLFSAIGKHFCSGSWYISQLKFVIFIFYFISPQTMYAHFQTYVYWAVLSHSLLHPESHPQSMCAHSHTHRGRTPTEHVWTQPHTERENTHRAGVYTATHTQRENSSGLCIRGF